MSKKTEPSSPEARLPKGLFDISAGEIRATGEMLDTIRRVFEPMASSRSTLRRSNIPTHSASFCLIWIGLTRACSPSRTTTSNGCRCAMT